jgi:nuclear pore complex protein Nup205
MGLLWIQSLLQLMYELCVDPVTCGPMVELLWGEKYEFFAKVHLSSSL